MTMAPPCKRAPEDEMPRRAVPQAGQRHRHHQVEIEPPGAAAAAAERDVDVVAQPARQRHVPAPPEIDDVERPIGRVEVERQLDAEQARGAERHLGIPREVEIELELEGDRPLPGGEEIERLAGGGGIVDARHQGAKLSARTTFLNSPMTKIVSPSIRLLGLIANAHGPLICEKISLWWVIGPASSCGKNITKKQYSRKSCSATLPRLVSTR